MNPFTHVPEQEPCANLREFLNSLSVDYFLGIMLTQTLTAY